MKTRLFKIAHTVKSYFATFSEALVYAWKVIKLQFRLCTEAVVCFTYKKVDGSIRDAVGTLETVPMPKGGYRKPTSYGLLNYFDLQQQEWRACRIENLIF